MLSPRSRCLDCDAEFDHDRFTMLCPRCGSIHLKLLQGRELQIDALEADCEPFEAPEEGFDPFARFLPQKGEPDGSSKVGRDEPSGDESSKDKPGVNNEMRKNGGEA
jgi:hypothetical protein